MGESMSKTKDPSKLTDAELQENVEAMQKEIQARALVKRTKALEFNRGRVEELRDLLNDDVIKLLTPDHNRDCFVKSGTDGFHGEETGDNPHCVRCGLVELLTGQAFWSDDKFLHFKLEMYVSRSENP